MTPIKLNLSDVEKLDPASLVTKLFSEYPLSDAFVLLAAADDAYFNTGGSILSDAQYDAVYRHTKSVEPHNVYFTGVGSAIRGGKVNLPYPMGSLNQKHDGGQIVQWITDNNLLSSRFTITDKLDGTSAMAIYSGTDDQQDIQIGYSRGDGVQGADITRHLSKFLPRAVNHPTNLVVRGEVILTKDGFNSLKDMVTRSNGEPYKNARNMVAGLMNSKTNPDIVYRYLFFVAYEIVGATDMSKCEMLYKLADLGFSIPHYTIWDGNTLSDLKLSEYVKVRKSGSPFEIDGIVVDVDSWNDRLALNPTKDTLNPEYSFKYKITDESNIAHTKVVRVEFNVSKHGYLKPTIIMEPIDLVGVTITKCTGFNVKFIIDNKIQPGCEIEMTRSGDVIPYCRGVTTPGPLTGFKYLTWLTQELDTYGEWEFTENDIDARLIDIDDNDTVNIGRLVDFFAKIDAPMLGDGNITKLYDAGIQTAESIINAPAMSLTSILGVNGSKVYIGLKDKLTNIPLSKLLGAYSNERGLGVRKFKILHEALGDDILTTLPTAEIICSVEGFDRKTATKALAVLTYFTFFLDSISNNVTVEKLEVGDGVFNGKKICFTGFRDKALSARVESAGGKIQSAVSGKTDIVVTTNPDGNTGKLKKAKDLGITVIGVEELREMLA